MRKEVREGDTNRWLQELSGVSFSNFFFGGDASMGTLLRVFLY